MDSAIDLHTDTVDKAIVDEPLVVEREITVREVFGLLQANGRGSVVVCDDAQPIGIFTERDVLKMMSKDADLDVQLEDVMITNPVTIHRSASVGEAIRVMSQGGYRRLPVVDDTGSLTGVIKVTGIVNYIVDHFPKTVFNLPPEPNPIMAEREGA